MKTENLKHDVRIKNLVNYLDDNCKI